MDTFNGVGVREWNCSINSEDLCTARGFQFFPNTLPIRCAVYWRLIYLSAEFAFSESGLFDFLSVTLFNKMYVSVHSVLLSLIDSDYLYLEALQEPFKYFLFIK